MNGGIIIQIVDARDAVQVVARFSSGVASVWVRRCPASERFWLDDKCHWDAEKLYWTPQYTGCVELPIPRKFDVQPLAKFQWNPKDPQEMAALDPERALQSRKRKRQHKPKFGAAE